MSRGLPRAGNGFVAGVWLTLTALLSLGCGAEETPVTTSRRTSALNASTTLDDFVVAASNSVRLQSGAMVVGGDVGARGVGTGPFLTGTFAVNVQAAAAVSADRNLIADSVQLGVAAQVGDVQPTGSAPPPRPPTGASRRWSRCPRCRRRPRCRPALRTSTSPSGPRSRPLPGDSLR